jgi:hypothetical protein
VITSVALGIKDRDGNHLHTIELNYQASSALDDPNWAPIVGLNLAYTYYPTYAEVLHAYNQSAKTPVFMGEANFEFEQNESTDGGTTRNLRMHEYWTMLSGTTGQLYGNHYIWRFLPDWRSYLDSPGVVQLGYMENLFGARKWYDLVPDQRHTFVTAGYGRFVSSGLFTGNDYVAAALTPDGSLGMAYLPQGGTITVAMTKLQNSIIARWFDPSANTFEAIAGSPFSNSGTQQFTSPGKNNAGDPDWVLVVETVTGPLRAPRRPLLSRRLQRLAGTQRLGDHQFGSISNAICRAYRFLSRVNLGDDRQPGRGHTHGRRFGTRHALRDQE